MRMGVFPDLVKLGVHFADLLVATFGADAPAYVEGHPLLEMALVELYRATGEDKYLDLAARQLNDRGRGLLGEGRFGSSYFQDELPVRESSVATGHAVRQLYLLAGATDVAVETDDRELLAAVETVWDDLYATKTYITGVHGSRYRDESIGDRYELPPDRAYAETCAAIAAFQLNWRLLMATGKAQFAEAMEVSLYNAIPASTSSAYGDAFTYVNPLQARPDHHGTRDTRLTRQPWFDCACCPPNLARLLASVHDYMVTTSDLWHPAAPHRRLRARGCVAGILGAGRGEDGLSHTTVPLLLAIDCEDGAGDWELSIRVPSWSSSAVVTLDAEPVSEQAVDGYLRLRRDWSGHHQLRLDLTLCHPAPPIRTTASTRYAAALPSPADPSSTPSSRRTCRQVRTWKMSRSWPSDSDSDSSIDCPTTPDNGRLHVAWQWRGQPHRRRSTPTHLTRP